MSGLYDQALSASQRLLNAIVYGLKEIDTENGYDNTIQEVFTEIPTASQLVNFPCIAIIQGRENTVFDSTEDFQNTLSITLMAFINNADDPTTGRLTLKKDIQRRLGVGWMVPGEDDVETVRLIRPSAYEPFGMFLNAPRVGFIMEIIAVYNQDVNDPTVST